MDMMKISKWEIEELPDLSGIQFISPSSYVFIFNTIGHVFDTIRLLSRREVMIQTTKYGEVLYVTDDGTVTIVNHDPWLNPDFKYGDVVTTAASLCDALVGYLKPIYNEEKH